MRNKLMAKEIKVNPAVGFSAGGTAKDTGVKAARGFKIGDRKGQMEAWIV